jgi:hypothetical protein
VLTESKEVITREVFSFGDMAFRIATTSADSDAQPSEADAAQARLGACPMLDSARDVIGVDAMNQADVSVSAQAS